MLVFAAEQCASTTSRMATAAQQVQRLVALCHDVAVNGQCERAARHCCRNRRAASRQDGRASHGRRRRRQQHGVDVLGLENIEEQVDVLEFQRAVIRHHRRLRRRARPARRRTPASLARSYSRRTARSLRIRFGLRAINASTAATGRLDFGAAHRPLLTANAQVEAPSMTASIGGRSKRDAVTSRKRAGCSANCAATGAIMTSGISSANISRLRTCESAICSRPSTSAIRGAESLTPL